MASHEAKTETHIAKLSDCNYRAWKTEIKWYLKGKSILEYALGTVTLAESATEAERKVFRTNDDKAMAAIGLHIEPNQQIHIEECNNAHEAWSALERIHQPINRVRIMLLKREFYHIKMKDSETMSSYVARTKIATAYLKQAGSEVKDEDLAYVILAGLPNTYENLNTALASLPDDRFTSSEVIRVLLAEYDRRRSRTDDNASELMEALQNDKKSKSHKTDKVSNTSAATKTTVCFNCKKTSHYARNCRSKSGNKQNQHYKNSKKDLDAFLVSLNNLDVEESWLLDSGCTHHVCKRRDWFQNFQEIEEETITQQQILRSKEVPNYMRKAWATSC
ncbi:rna-dependent dna polymerase [Lasius niger]|uniref:Rna-dependent dna polymerase n=1 Tax=Lasius niger TaxID=67767 RepID=A0A0J7KFQ6_LASNI|nr:rna-dependent dna polymerase [Lasius niger]